VDLIKEEESKKIIQNLIENLSAKYNDIHSLITTKTRLGNSLISFHEINYSTELITSINEIINSDDFKKYSVAELEINFSKNVENIPEIIEGIKKIYKKYLPTRSNPKYIRLDNLVYFKNKDEEVIDKFI
jgi:molybdopterin converting factor small subunit